MDLIPTNFDTLFDGATPAVLVDICFIVLQLGARWSKVRSPYDHHTPFSGPASPDSADICIDQPLFRVNPYSYDALIKVEQALGQIMPAPTAYPRLHYVARATPGGVRGEFNFEMTAAGERPTCANTLAPVDTTLMTHSSVQNVLVLCCMLFSDRVTIDRVSGTIKWGLDHTMPPGRILA